MPKRKLTEEFLKRLKAIDAKRPKTVIDHILKHDFITTEELKNKYGYNHPPRAARDVRDCGIPLETFTVEDTEGRKIAAYRFGDPAQVGAAKASGRRAIGVKVKNALIELTGASCTVCGKATDSAQLQVDHRVPYVVAPDDPAAAQDISKFMLICQPCNRAKSWSCEHCPNWLKQKRPETCQTCYWANPEKYSHIAMTETRRLDLTWQGDEVADYGRLRARAEKRKQPFPDFVKRALKRVADEQE